MKKILKVSTRWEYYVSNIAGLIAVIGFTFWFIYLAIGNDGINLKSIFFWLAFLLIIMIPFALISILSSMKSVEVTQKGLVISYAFKKHKNNITFSEIAEFKSKRSDRETVVRPRSIQDTFTLVLNDGRVFEFSRSQFNNYSSLKSICYKGVNGK